MGRTSLANKWPHYAPNIRSSTGSPCLITLKATVRLRSAITPSSTTCEKLGQSKGQMGSETPQGALGQLDHQAYPKGRNSVLISISDKINHPNQYQHGNTQRGGGGSRPKQCLTTSNLRLVGGEVSASPDLHCSIPITDMCLAPQEGKDSQVSSQRLGSEARDSDYMAEGPRQART